MMFVGPWDFSVMMLWFWDLFRSKSDQSLGQPDGSCGSVSLIRRVIRFWVFPQSVFLVGRFFFSLNQPSLTNHVGDQPDLKWGYPFEQAALGILAAGSCVLIWGCRKCICCSGPEATPPPGSCLGEKTLPSHSLSLDNRKELCFCCYFEREMWLLGYGRWRLDPISGTAPGTFLLPVTCLLLWGWEKFGLGDSTVRPQPLGDGVMWAVWARATVS